MPFFNSGDRRLHYRTLGRGPMVLILPGNTASSALHSADLSYFGQWYHAVGLDFWGTGQSDRASRWPDDWWTIAAHDAAAVISYLGHQHCVVIGTSGGAAVALLLAALYPDRIRAVIADSEVPAWPADWLRNMINGRAQRSAEQIAFWRAAHGDDWSQVVEADSDLVLRMTATGLAPFASYTDRIRCPVLFTGSLLDDLLPDVGPQLCALAQSIPSSSLFLAREGSHPFMWSRPEAFRAVSSTFLARVWESEHPW